MRVARFGHGALAALLAGGIFRRNQAHKLHELPWAFKPCQVPHFGHQGDGHRALHPPQGLESFDYRIQTPGFDMIVQFLFETLETFAVFIDCAAIFLEDDLLHRHGTDDLREPPQVGRAPSGSAGVTDIVSEQKGFEAKLGVFQITEGIFPRTGEITNGFILDFGDIDRGEISRARQAGQLHGIPTVGFDPVAGLFRDQRGGHDPAGVAFFHQVPGEPVAIRAGLIDENPVLRLGLHLTDELINVTLAGANGAEVHDLGAVILRHVGHGNRVFVDIRTDEECATLGPGCPPSLPMR
jgi:hypothetical protein